MVEKKPLSTDELLNISGVGEKKAARYGNAFLRIIEDAVGSRRVKQKERRPSTRSVQEVENRTLFSVVFIFP